MNFKVFPATITPEGQKIPIIKDWHELASNDPSQIQAWINQFGSQLSLWGIPTGDKNGIVAVDIDVKKVNGFETVRSLNLSLPHTLSQTTVSGGKHFIYKNPEGIKFKNTVGSFGDGIDTRGERGWIGLYGLDNTPIADAPEWLIKSIKDETPNNFNSNYKIEINYANDLLDELCEKVMSAPQGESNNVLNLVAFEAAQLFLTTNTFTKDHVSTALMAAAKLRGKSEYEARSTINSGFEGGIKNGPRFDCPFVNNPLPVLTVYEPIDWTPMKATIADLMNTNFLRRPQLFEDWSTEDIQLTTADGGTGKTTLKLYEAICLALGRRFLGRQCMQRGNTLYIIGEDDVEKIYSIIGQMCKQLELTPEEYQIVIDSIYIKKDTELTVITKDRQTSFLNPNLHALEVIMKAVDKIKPKLIVFDPIASFWGSEALLNDMSKAVTKFMSMLRHRSNACVEMINHMGKSSSQSKDNTQFSGRGGSALPSHSRVVRTLRGINAEEYTELTGQVLGEKQRAMVCYISKFTDGSDLLDKPLVIVRTGYLFEMIESRTKTAEPSKSDIQVVLDFIMSYRNDNKYPTRNLIIAEAREFMSRDRVVYSLNILQHKGHDGYRIKYIDNLDVTEKEKCIVLTDLEMNEL